MPEDEDYQISSLQDRQYTKRRIVQELLVYAVETSVKSALSFRHFTYWENVPQHGTATAAFWISKQEQYQKLLTLR
jgi:hypothetical protein